MKTHIINIIQRRLHKMPVSILHKYHVGSIMSSSSYVKKNSYKIKKKTSVLGTKIKRDNVKKNVEKVS